MTHTYRGYEVEVIEREGRTNYVRLKDTLPVDKLLTLGLITMCGHAAAVDFISLHEVALSPLGTARLRHSLEWGRSTSDLDPFTLYLRINKNMRPYERHLIDRFCFQEVRENDYKWARLCSKSIEESFEKLAKVIDSLRNSDNVNSEEGTSVSKI